jgi:hypothetical protein
MVTPRRVEGLAEVNEGNKGDLYPTKLNLRFLRLSGRDFREVRAAFCKILLRAATAVRGE